MKTSAIIALSIVGVLGTAGAAMAVDLTPDYLEGKWTTGSTDNCKAGTHEQTVFHKDGTLTTEHKGKTLAVGFWTLTDDKLDMNILTTESSLPQDVAEALPGDYHALNIKGLLFDATDKSFRLVQGIAGEIQGVEMVRCPD